MQFMFLRFTSCSIFFSISFEFMQAVPVPTSRAPAVQDIFNLAAEKLGFKFVTLKSKFLVTRCIHCPLL